MFSILYYLKEVNPQVNKCWPSSWVKASAFITYYSLIFKS